MKTGGYPEKIERNKEIYNKKMGKGYPRAYTYRELMIEYDLSLSALYTIIQRYQKKGKFYGIDA